MQSLEKHLIKIKFSLQTHNQKQPLQKIHKKRDENHEADIIEQNEVQYE